MNTLNTITCRGFILCTSGITPNDGFVLANAGQGKEVQFVYINSGGGCFRFANGDVLPFEGGNIYDISQYVGTPVRYEADERGAHGMAIDPVPNDKRYDYELVKGEATRTVVGENREQKILCLDGTIVCNDIELKSTQYAPVVNGKTVNVSVPANAVMVILTAR
jgi:hypothetical protein